MTASPAPALLTKEQVEPLLSKLRTPNSVSVLAPTHIFAPAEAAALLQHIAALEQRVEAADKLWKLCVAEGFPWSDGSVQDELTELGFLVATDMTGEDESEQCTNCEGDCQTCYRSIESLAALPKEPR